MLSGVPLFALLDDQERAILAERVDRAAIPAGSVVFHYGDPGDALYVVVSGEVEIFFKNDTGERIVLETVRAGQFFGEISLLDAGPRTASAVVTEDLEALVIDRGDLDELFRLKPAAAMDLLAASGRRQRETARLLRHTASRNVNDQTPDERTLVMKAADWIAAFSGSMPFLGLHILGFSAWILLNVGPLRATPLGGFDPFPFGLLTMVVSLEAIILSVFVLLSQNRQVERERVRNDIEYDVNLKAELEIAHLHEKLDHLHGEVLGRLAGLERAQHGSPPRRGGRAEAAAD
jgi:uncharacterized membrane protein